MFLTKQVICDGLYKSNKICVRFDYLSILN